MKDLRTRFERYVDRSGEHHVWTGATDIVRGTGRLKIDGRVITAHRAAWELEHGPLPAGAKVAACSQVASCVRIEHLTADVDGLSVSNREGEEARTPRPRARKGTGSLRRVRRGVWELTVTGSNADGSARRVYGTAYVDTEEEARVELARLVTEVHDGDGVTRQELRRLTFDEAVKRYLYEHLLDEKGREPRGQVPSSGVRAVGCDGVDVNLVLGFCRQLVSDWYHVGSVL